MELRHRIWSFEATNCLNVKFFQSFVGVSAAEVYVMLLLWSCRPVEVNFFHFVLDLRCLPFSVGIFLTTHFFFNADWRRLVIIRWRAEKQTNCVHTANLDPTHSVVAALINFDSSVKKCYVLCCVFWNQLLVPESRRGSTKTFLCCFVVQLCVISEIFSDVRVYFAAADLFSCVCKFGDFQRRACSFCRRFT